jgi:hypothetical protein
MRVALKRNLFLGGQRFRADPQGVDLPDIVDGRELILHKDYLKRKNEAKDDAALEELDEKYLSLPRDAELYTEPVKGIKSLNTRGKTIPPQFPVNPSQSPPPGPTPTEGSASMAIDMVDAERLVDDMNDPKTPKLTADEAREKVERDKAKDLAEAERSKHESTVVKASDANTLSGLTRAAEKDQVKDQKTLSEMNKGQPNVAVKK